jgi:hypothetical protein
VLFRWWKEVFSLTFRTSEMTAGILIDAACFWAGSGQSALG